uniref:(California timema) hypothetical protein n=1 Tax=Timema californicum TaxID=61474 RepID=A0A7R9P9W9_TIMCA|nr:unnamed protein product [Timema californicum]
MDNMNHVLAGQATCAGMMTSMILDHGHQKYVVTQFNELRKNVFVVFANIHRCIVIADKAVLLTSPRAPSPLSNMQSIEPGGEAEGQSNPSLLSLSLDISLIVHIIPSPEKLKPDNLLPPRSTRKESVRERERERVKYSSGKTTLSMPNWDLNPYLPIIGSPFYCESDASGKSATEFIREVKSHDNDSILKQQISPVADILAWRNCQGDGIKIPKLSPHKVDRCLSQTARFLVPPSADTGASVSPNQMNILDMWQLSEHENHKEAMRRIV